MHHFNLNTGLQFLAKTGKNIVSGNQINVHDRESVRELISGVRDEHPLLNHSALFTDLSSNFLEIY